MNICKLPESALVVIHTVGFEVLLIERADAAGFWQSVTGSKSHSDESLRDTARREVAEETGIAIGGLSVPSDALVDWRQHIAYDIDARWRHRYASGITRNTEHWFGLTVPRDIEITLAPREHTAFEWLPYRAAAARCFSQSNHAAILQLPLRLNYAAR